MNAGFFRPANCMAGFMATRVYVLIILFFLQQCHGKDKSIVTQFPLDQQTGASADTTTTIDAFYLNQITVKPEGGLVIAQAFLSDEAGNLKAPGNKVSTGEAVYLTLVIKEGWISKGGFLSLGAAQSITTDTGEPVLKTTDLFAGRNKLQEADGRRLRLKTVITHSRPDIKYYVVHYRVWDKSGTGGISGYYKLIVTENE